jgi:hypothetical protein
LSAGILAQAGSGFGSVSYEEVKWALSLDASSADDLMAVAHLPLGNFISFRTTDKDGNIIIDNNHSLNNEFLSITRANAKALGFIGDDGLADADITFNTDFTFDFNRSDGITSGQLDFVGIAMHEIVCEWGVPRPR